MTSNYQKYYRDDKNIGFIIAEKFGMTATLLSQEDNSYMWKLSDGRTMKLSFNENEAKLWMYIKDTCQKFDHIIKIDKLYLYEDDEDRSFKPVICIYENVKDNFSLQKIYHLINSPDLISKMKNYNINYLDPIRSDNKNDLSKKELVDLLLNGGCQIFAVELQKKIGGDIIYFNSEYGLTHAVVFYKGQYIDASGITNIQRIQQSYLTKLDIEKISTNKVIEHIKSAEVLDFLEINHVFIKNIHDHIKDIQKKIDKNIHYGNML